MATRQQGHLHTFMNVCKRKAKGRKKTGQPGLDEEAIGSI
jgi:hypothetical protein